MDEAVVPAAFAWKSNAHLIADVARLGYLSTTDAVLDCTWGLGGWWKLWRPEDLNGCDLVVAKSPIGYSVDFTAMPFGDGTFDVVCFDPPYKLNGTPTVEVDDRYGVAEVTRWQDRHALMVDGLIECARVAGRLVLVKCQDQVCSGKMRWQTDLMTETGASVGMTKVNEFLHLGGRAQPMAGRTQRHPHGRPSSLLVFEVGK